MQPLYRDRTLTFDAYEKVAAETMLPEDQSTWDHEILQAAFKQAPFISDFDVEAVLDRVDAERGFAFGHLEISSKTELPSPGTEGDQEAIGMKRGRIPIIVKDKKLQPLDLLVTENSTIVPLNQRRVREAMFRPQMFDVTSKTPGDMSLVGQLFPPYRQNFGYGGGAGFSSGMGKEGSELEHLLVKWADETNKPAKGNLNERLSKVLGIPQDQLAVRLKAKSVASPVKTGAVANANLFNKGSMTIKAVLKGKTKTGSLLGAVLPYATASDVHALRDKILEPATKLAFLRNADAALPSLEKVVTARPISTEKLAGAMSLPPTVAQVLRDGSMYVVKTANPVLWAPKEEHLTRRELIHRFGEKVALDADVNGSITMAPDGVEENNPELEPKLITDFGLYRVQDVEGQFLLGQVFTNLIDITGQRLPLSLFTNGSAVAVQADIVGEPSGKSSAIPSGTPSGVGAFVRQLSNGSYDATVPLEIKASSSMEGERKMMASTFDGRDVMLAIQPNIKEPLLEGDTFLVPQSFTWMPLGSSKTTALVSDVDAYNAPKEAQNKVATVVVRGSPDMGSFSMDGYAVRAIPSNKRQQMTLDDTMFVLGGLGTNMKYAMKKIATAIRHNRPAELRVGNVIKVAENQVEGALKRAASKTSKTAGLRVSLVKEAAIIPDPNAVDTVLSLGLITDDNVASFVEALPEIESAVSYLCQLLLAVRLGLSDIPKEALEKAIKSIEPVIEGLRVIAFQKP